MTHVSSSVTSAIATETSTPPARHVVEASEVSPPPYSQTHHIHDEASMRRLVNRLSRIEGHIRGIKTMVQEHRPCPDVLTQVAAVRGALDKVARSILDEHLTDCITQAAKDGDMEKIDEEIAHLRSALNQFF